MSQLTYNLTKLTMGTEKLEQIVNETFKNAKTLRMDIDTTSKKGSHKKLIDLFNKSINNNAKKTNKFGLSSKNVIFFKYLRHD